MLTVIYVSLLLLLVLLPIPLLLLFDKQQKRREKKQLLQRFHQAGQEAHLTFSCQELLRNQLFGLDGVHRKMLLIEKDAFKDSSGYTLAKNDTINFQTASESEYGSIRLQFFKLDTSKNPVLQFVQNNLVVDSVALTSDIFYRKLFKPGDYDLRILYDTDKSMTWTPGDFELKKQPEIVIAIPRKITIKQNWDNEVNVNL